MITSFHSIPYHHSIYCKTKIISYHICTVFLWAPEHLCDHGLDLWDQLMWEFNQSINQWYTAPYSKIPQQYHIALNRTIPYHTIPHIHHASSHNPTLRHIMTHHSWTTLTWASSSIPGFSRSSSVASGSEHHSSSSLAIWAEDMCLARDWQNKKTNKR